MRQSNAVLPRDTCLLLALFQASAALCTGSGTERNTMLQRTLAFALVAGTALAGPVQAADLTSVSRIAFGPPNTLFVADWKGAQIEALTLPPADKHPDTSFNMLDLDALIRTAVGTDDVKVEGLAKRPGTDEVYIALSAGPDRKPAILVVTPDGKGRALDLAALHATNEKLEDAPDGNYKFWDRTPLRSFTVTDMKWHRGKLFVAGLSNQTFASSLRILNYPFGGPQSITSVAMYHTTHNQVETRAPIRAMTFETLGGKDTLVAAYLCTPLVTIPVDALKNGAHVQGKTIAELGYGNYPNGMISLSSGAPSHASKQILITNAFRSADLVPVAEIAKADAAPGLSKPVPFGDFAGVKAHELPFGGVMAIDNQNDKYLVAVRPGPESGHLQLVSINKMFNFRVSDFISEYDFPTYKFPAGYQTQNIKPIVDTMAREENVANQIKP